MNWILYRPVYIIASLALILCTTLPTGSLRAVDEPWIRTWQLDLGRGEAFYRIPSSLPIRRSFQDAWTSDGLFVPEYYRAIPFLPKETGLTAETSSIRFRMETDFWDLFYVGLGVGFKQYNPTESTLSTIQDRNRLQSAIYADLIPLNQLRSNALTAVTMQPFTSEWMVLLTGRMPFWFWETSWMRPYAEFGLGVGGCVEGESCNLTMYNAGLGMEFMRDRWNFVPYVILEASGTNQQRIRRSIWIEESSIHFGVRYYR